MNFHGGYFGDKALIDFSVNIPPLSYPEGLKELMMETFDNLRRYPEIDGVSSKQAISEKTGFDLNEIILGNGATELIYLFSRSVGVKRALILEPTFTEYRRALELNGVEVLSFSLLDYVTTHGKKSTIDMNHPMLVSDIVNSIKENNVDLLVICNPNNPTGHLYTRDFVKDILNAIKNENFKIFIDESFLDFVPDEKRLTCEILKEDLDKVFLLRSMTKNFEVPGLRIGYGLCHKNVIELMKRYKEPWSLNAYALAAIPFLIHQDDHLSYIRKWCKSESDYLASEFDTIEEINYYKGNANYLLIKIPKILESSFFDEMVGKNIYLRKCEDFRGLGKSYYRIAIRERNENEKLVNAIKEVFHEKLV